MSTRRTIDYQNGDVEFLAEFEKQLEMLYGMVEEMFVENKACLLSPVMRQLLIDKARSVKARHEALRYKLCVDNLNGPLKEQGK